MKWQNLLLLIVAISIITSVVTFVALEKMSLEAVEMVAMEITVGDHYGLEVADEDLKFGIIKPGAGSIKLFHLYGDERSHIIHIAAQGDMAEWTTFSHNHFILDPYEQLNVSVTVNVPMGTPLGDYTGTMVVEMKRP